MEETEKPPVPKGPELTDYSHVLLFRHGHTDDKPAIAEHDRVLSPKGTADVEQVARRLAEQLFGGPLELKIRMVHHGTFVQVRMTRDLISQAMESQKKGSWHEIDVHAKKDLNPDVFRKEDALLPPDVAHWAKGTKKKEDQTLLLIGHEPQLSAMAGKLLGVGGPKFMRFGNYRGVVTPSGGVSCIRLKAGLLSRPRVMWVIEPSDKTTTEQLREKIKSKMDVAKVFGAVITFALGIVLNVLVDGSKVGGMKHPLGVQSAAGVLGIALALYIATMYAFDTLLMPTRFWNPSGVQEKRWRHHVVDRPPSSANLVMQQNMVRIWSHPFTLANILVVFAFGLLAWGTMDISPGWLLGTAVLAVALASWARHVDLGVQD